MKSQKLFPFPSLDWTQPKNAHAWLQKLLDSFVIGILIMDESGQVCMANAAAHEIFDVPPALPLGEVARFLPPEDVAKFEMNRERILRRECPSSEDHFLLRGDAGRWVSCAFTPLPEQQDGQKLTLITLVDVSAEKKALEQHDLAAKRYRALFETAADAMMVLSPQGILLDLNTMTCEHLNMTREELLGEHLRTIFTSAKQPVVLSNLETILNTGQQRSFEALLTNPESPIPVEINARPIEFDGQTAVLGVARDITERKILQKRLEYQASTDPLTGLNNRRHFLLKADQELLRFKRYGNSFAMLMLDLDFFKHVNDTYGHQTGDALLREFARQMRDAFRYSDVLGRIGGEEFSVVLLESSLHRGIEIAERLRQQVEKSPLQLNENTVPYTVSIGVTTASTNDASLDGIMRRADAALYRAKRNGRNQVEFEKAPDAPEQPAQEDAKPTSHPGPEGA